MGQAMEPEASDLALIVEKKLFERSGTASIKGSTVHGGMQLRAWT